MLGGGVDSLSLRVAPSLRRPRRSANSESIGGGLVAQLRASRSAAFELLSHEANACRTLSFTALTMLGI